MRSKRTLLILAAVLSILSALSWFLYHQDMLGPLDPREEWEKPLGPQDAARTGDQIISREQAQANVDLVRRLYGNCDPPSKPCPRATRSQLRDATEVMLWRAWVLAEAREKGIRADQRQVEKLASDAPSFMKKNVSSGVLREEAEFMSVHDQLLATRPEQIKVPETRIRWAYENTGVYKRPQRRKGYALRFSAREQAERARRDWVSNLPYPKVFKKHVMDASTLATKGLVPMSTPRQMNPAYAAAFFVIPRGQVSKPLKLGGAWWLLKVMSIDPAVSVPYQEARPKIIKAYQEQLAARESDKSRAALIRKWKSKTKCAADLRNRYCRNG